MSGFYVTAEVCAESLADVRAAAAGGADRIELCEQLASGGLSPSPPLLHDARAATTLPIFAMLRTRAGDFSLRAGELAQVLAQLGELREAGADGFVFGVLTTAGGIADDALQRVIEHAAPLPVVFHRAFDLVADQAEALEQLIGCGCVRVLTSGDPRGVEHGRERLRALVERAGDRIEVMPGGGVRAHNAAAILRASGARSLHFSAKSDYSRSLRAEDVRAVVSALRSF